MGPWARWARGERGLGGAGSRADRSAGGSERRLLAGAGGGGGSRGGRREAGGGGETATGWSLPVLRPRLAGAARRTEWRRGLPPSIEWRARSADPRGTRARLLRGAAAHGERAGVAGAALGLEAAAGREEREDRARAAWAASAATRRGGRGAWLLRRRPGPLSAPPARLLRFVPKAPEGAAPLGGARLPASACLVHLDACSGEVRGAGRRRP